MSKEGSSEEVPQDAAANEGGKKDAHPDIYENRAATKVIRLITVMAYMFSVSFVAIVLSAYYIFLWEPPNPRLLKRPVHLSSEPEVQFLLSDPPVIFNHSNGIPRKNFITVDPVERTVSNNLRKSLTGRVVGDARDQTAYNREKLDESLFLLRNSLMDFLRSKSNDSKDNNSSGKNSGIQSSSGKDGKSRDQGETRSRKDENFFSNVEDPKVRDNNTSLTLDSSSISGDEVNKDRFTSDRNSSPLRNDVHRDIGSTENTIIDRENIPARFLAAVDKQNMKMKINAVENSKEFTNTARGTTITNESRIIMTAGDPKVEEQRRDRANTGVRANDRSIVDYADNLEFPPSNVSSAKLSNATMNLKETQIEKIVDKLMTPPSSETQESEVTSQRHKDLLTILTETETFSSSPVPVSESFQTDSSTEPDVSTKNHREST